MSATVHYLFGAEPAPAEQLAAGAVPRMSHPLVEELKALSLPQHEELLAGMFRGADDALFEMGEKAATNTERRLYLDTMRLLRLEQARITRSCLRELTQAFLPLTAVKPVNTVADRELQRLSLQPSEELEEKIALGNMATRAQQRHQEQLWDLERRLQELAGRLGTPISPRAYSPQTICEAFRGAIATLEVEFQTKLVLYKLYERAVVDGLDRVYGPALSLLERHGVQAPPPGRTAPARTAQAVAAPAVDAHTLSALQQQQTAWSGAAQPDAQLAAELAASVQNLVATPGRVAAVQRLALVGQLCNELLGDAQLPAVLRETLERLRFPLIKIALADHSFFANRAHPVRELLDQAAEIGSLARAVGPVALLETERRLRSLVEQVNLSSHFVRPALDAMAPLSSLDVSAFLEQLREQDLARREVLLAKVRRVVAQEIDLRSLSQSLPAGALRFLRSGWGPLLALRLLRHGIGSQPWNEGLARLEQLLAALGDAAGEHTKVRAFEALLNLLQAELFTAGMRQEKIEGLLQSLREAYDETRPRTVGAAVQAPAPSAPAVAHAIMAGDGLLLPGVGMLELPEDALGPEPVAPPPAAAPMAANEIPDLSTELTPLSDWQPHGAALAQEPAQLLARILLPETWFRVYDSAQDQTLWLRLNAYYPKQDCVSFSGFDAERTLSLHSAQFLQDLVAGRSEPINPGDDAYQAWLALRRTRAQSGS